jgi:glycine/D-amino acid oxidase-like deaminating enzyme
MTIPLWLLKKLPSFPKVTRSAKFDAVVVGAGITGITTAYLLKQAGYTVALIERDRCASVDTGHTTAHLTYVTDLRLSKLVRYFGNDHARAVWDAGKAAMQQIEELIAAEEIDCDFRKVPGFLHASLAGGRDETKSLREDAELVEKLGFDATFMDEVPYFKFPGVCFANQAKFHPLKYLAALIRNIPGKGSKVFEQSEVTEFGEEPLSVTANGKKLTCDFVVIATHVPLTGNTGLASATGFQTKLAPYSSYVLGAELPKGKVPEASYWDTTDPYYYLRIELGLHNDYAIFGGADHKTGQASRTEECFASLKETLQRHLPDAKVKRSWSGQVIETNDGLPYMGETAERQFVATGFAGNGMTFGTLAAMMARNAFLKQKNPWQELFSVNRKKLRGGTWDYVKENLDYPYYLLKDRLKSAEGESLADVKLGEGKILRLQGNKVAVSRGADGKVHTVSPVFDIQFAFSGLTTTQQAIFEQAAAKWESIIVGDLPSVTYNGQVIDDLVITATATSIDGVGNILGQAGPDQLRSDSLLPYAGSMEFDGADLASMQTNVTLLGVIEHEMGHVLGIGTLWASKGLLVGAGTSNPLFTGAQAAAAYNSIFGTTATGVPVENTGASGTADAHWRESIFASELMTGWVGPSATMPISRITVGSLADIGYTVNMAAADTFTPPSSVSLLSPVAASTTSTSPARSRDHVHSEHDQMRAAIDAVLTKLGDDSAPVSIVPTTERKLRWEDAVDRILTRGREKDWLSLGSRPA